MIHQKTFGNLRKRELYQYKKQQNKCVNCSRKTKDNKSLCDICLSRKRIKYNERKNKMNDTQKQTKKEIEILVSDLVSKGHADLEIKNIDEREYYSFMTIHFKVYVPNELIYYINQNKNTEILTIFDDRITIVF